MKIIVSKVFLMSHQYERAYNNIFLGNQILENNTGNCTIDSANSYITLAQIQYKLKQFKQTKYLYECALGIYTNLLGIDHIFTYRIYLNLLYIAFLLKDDEEIESIEKIVYYSLKESVSYINK
jgi:hypothetical protein